VRAGMIPKSVQQFSEEIMPTKELMTIRPNLIAL
jgi:hypothetical protein